MPGSGCNPRPTRIGCFIDRRGENCSGAIDQVALVCLVLGVLLGNSNVRVIGIVGRKRWVSPQLVVTLVAVEVVKAAVIALFVVDVMENCGSIPWKQLQRVAPAFSQKFKQRLFSCGIDIPACIV